MNNYWKIYWWTRLDTIQVLFTVLAVFGAIIFAVWIGVYLYKLEDGYEEDIKNYVKNNKKYRTLGLVMAIIGLVFASFTPNKNEALLIMAGGKTLNFVQSDTSLSKIPAQTTTVVSTYLNNAIKELKGEDKK